ncbi:MAG: Gfo/Idh/MocA family oxidoreductase [Bryobacteraceae bacterium]
MADQDVSRRDFVKTAGAVTAVASAIPNRAPAFQKARAANSQVQYGFIGTGSRGTYLLKHLNQVDGGRCVAVCDTYEPNLQKGVATAGTSPASYRDYRELLSRQDIDCVLIATPLYMHFPVTRDVLLAGKHVFCEKSLVFKPEEVHALRAICADRPKQILQVGLQRRYSAFYQAAKEMIDQGMLGKITHVRAQWHRNTTWRRKVDDPKLERQINWRMYREYSGGLTAELASHQIDVADWMFGMHPEMISGVGGIDFYKDGRDIYDNIQLIFAYPGGQKLMYSSIQTNAHLDMLLAQRQEFGEVIMGTEGTIHITVGSDDQPATALWFQEPSRPKVTPAAAKKENWKAGATMTTGAAGKPLPILLSRDLQNEDDSFLQQELKFAKRWLYTKGILVPEEDRNPVTVSMEEFLISVRDGKRPKADLEVGLMDATGVILANKAMDEGRRVYWNEIDKMGRTPEATRSTKG